METLKDQKTSLETTTHQEALLSAAAENNNIEMAKFLMRQQSWERRYTSTSGAPPFLLAIQEGNIEIMKVLQQEDKLIFLARYWISPNDAEAEKLTTPGTALARPSQISERMSDLKAFFSGLRLREDTTVSWTNIRVKSEADLPAKLRDVKGEL